MQVVDSTCHIRYKGQTNGYGPTVNYLKILWTLRVESNKDQMKSLIIRNRTRHKSLIIQSWIVSFTPTSSLYTQYIYSLHFDLYIVLLFLR